MGLAASFHQELSSIQRPAEQLPLDRRTHLLGYRLRPPDMSAIRSTPEIWQDKRDVAVAVGVAPAEGEELDLTVPVLESEALTVDGLLWALHVLLPGLLQVQALES
jgi:hypothetical protein